MNQGEHITQELAIAWQEKTLKPESVAAIASHLSRCERCRALVSPPLAPSRLASSFVGKGEHLDYENLEALVKGKTSDDDWAIYQRHLSLCAVCSAELADLREFSEVKPAKGRRRLLVPIAGLVISAAVLFLVIRPAQREGGSAPTVPIVVSLTDSGRIISLDAKGALKGLEGASPALATLVNAALRTGEIPLPTENRLSSGRELLLGNSTGQTLLQGFTPAGSVVPATSPHFSWTAPPGSSHFVVAVYTTDFNPIIHSPDLSAPEWVCTATLTPGTTYIWTVSATVNGSRVTAPRSPEPEARFRLATASEAAEWAAVQNLKPGSDLAQALTALRLSMFPEADAALTRLERENAGVPIVAKIRETLSAHAQTPQ